ncbi:outer membrane lipoprotein chaperone LolA [Caenimonas koreensis DSM 17982]|uniref:Outer-membrane lipoprotein carrier protein n=1 Tax=Caenimonas koreensis DSM 17982 TaxID=1121255 RepID=A0A844AYQ2_9BURK|nr:outer membrane lipoprotein chaperone LolA [Caenimonas koreensis]MRD46192.1 outer membrane lipoprotein chaperone LolA [Caenimonas koreensis DSM 17982]
MKRIVATLSLIACMCGAHAGGVESLENFMKTAKSGRADFTQVVTAPAREGQVSKSKTSSGTFEFARPNRFRFNYKRPFEQTIVADGQTLWLYDADLRQVTKRAQAQVLAQTPAAIIAAAPDLATLRKDFNVEAAGEKDGIDWVQATPKTKEGQVHSIKVGFRGNELAVLDILDGFGQRSVMTFSKMDTNAKVGTEVFDFKPPQNADVIKQ